MPALVPFLVGGVLGAALHRFGRPGAMAVAGVLVAIAWAAAVNARTYHDAPTWMVVIAATVLALTAGAVGAVVGFASASVVSRGGRRTRHPSR